MSLPNQYCLVSYLENATWYEKCNGKLFLEGPAPAFGIECTTWKQEKQSVTVETVDTCLRSIGAMPQTATEDKHVYLLVPSERIGLWSVQDLVQRAVGISTGRLTVCYNDLEDYIESWTKRSGIRPGAWNHDAIDADEWNQYSAYATALRAADTKAVNRERILWATLFARTKQEWDMILQFERKNDPKKYTMELGRLEFISKAHFGPTYLARPRL